uniref:Uncharacterized protein n=1 Tax=Anguilla anguilla TaxID=7936 RepID=A0A0E9WBG8_ANGAN
MPCAEDLRPCINRSVSQGARSPMSTCLFLSLSGTGSTFHVVSLRM